MSDSVLIALIVAASAIVTGLIGYAGLRQGQANGKQTRETHFLINSRMDELLRMTRESARAEGVAAGEQSQRDRQSPPEATT